MNTYTLSGNPAAGTIRVNGDTIQEAISTNIDCIRRAFEIGNAAGYRLEKAWLDGARDGETQLHIVATGDDGLIGYDPIADQPREYSIRVSGLQPGELAEREEFRLVDGDSPFDPMDPIKCTGKIDCLGALEAIADRISEHHCAIRGKNPPTVAVGSRFSKLDQLNTQAYISQIMMLLAKRRPKHNKDADRLMDRAEELVCALSDVRSLTLEEIGMVVVRRYQAKHYFDTAGKITALAKYRKSAGMTQEQLAGAVGISGRQIAAYENARTSNLGNARHYIVQRIADALGISPDMLVRDGIVVRVQPD